MNNDITITHCFLGLGYTSIIGSILLKERGINSIIVEPYNSKPIFKIRIGKQEISPLPIFPVIPSNLFDKLNLEEFTDKIIIEYIDNNIIEIANYDIQDSSLAAFVWENQKDSKAFSLSMKQWGQSILTKPYTEVQNKITRHYHSNIISTRVGYRNGLSPYYNTIQNPNYNVVNYSKLKAIDHSNKVLYIDNIKLHFTKLISTIPLQNLFTSCGFNILSPLIYVGSYFFYFTHSSIFNENRVLYDCNIESNILRIFSATPNILVVQLPSYSKADILEIKNRIKQLIPEIKSLNFEKSLYLPISYPVESVTNFEDLNNISILESRGIIPFGRFGSWKYLDLHELKWDLIL